MPTEIESMPIGTALHQLDHASAALKKVEKSPSDIIILNGEVFRKNNLAFGTWLAQQRGRRKPLIEIGLAETATDIISHYVRDPKS